LRTAVQRALDLKDDQAFFAAAGWALRRLLALRDVALMKDMAMRIVAHKRDGLRPLDVATCLQYAGLVLFEHGDRGAAEEAWRDQGRIAERTHDASSAIWTFETSALLAFVDGRLDEAVSIVDSMYIRQHELGVSSDILTPAIEANIRGYIGLPYEHLLNGLGPIRPAQAQKALILGRLGRFPEARMIGERFENVGSPEDESAKPVLLNLLELSVLSQDSDSAASLLHRLAPFASLLAFSPGLSIGRLCGAAAKLLGRPDEARGYYDQALGVCEKVSFRPEIALIRLELAELLLEYYLDERETAIDHLDFAVREFREMKMQPSLERALRHRGLLKA
jgi:tetratricopeptide (TPR) repeat protein